MQYALAGVPPPRTTLDALFASLQPVLGRWTEIWANVVSTGTADSTKAAWRSAMMQANSMLLNASIEGQLGQRLAMGDATVEQWKNEVNTAVNLMEFVQLETGSGGYSIQRVWNEIVVPTVVQTGTTAADIGKKATDWGPLALAAALGLVAITWASSVKRGLFSGYTRIRRRRRR